MIQCNNCGYPVINGMHTCPNCLAEMPDEIVAPLPADEDAYEYNEDEIPICSLRPIALPNEREMPEEVYEEGAEVYLFREIQSLMIVPLTTKSRHVCSSQKDIGSLKIGRVVILRMFTLVLALSWNQGTSSEWEIENLNLI